MLPDPHPVAGRRDQASVESSKAKADTFHRNSSAVCRFLTLCGAYCIKFSPHVGPRLSMPHPVWGRIAQPSVEVSKSKAGKARRRGSMAGGGVAPAFHSGLARLPPRSTQGPARDLSVPGTTTPGTRSMRHVERAGAREACMRRCSDPPPLPATCPVPRLRAICRGRRPRHHRERAFIIYPFPLLPFVPSRCRLLGACHAFARDSPPLDAPPALRPFPGGPPRSE